MVIYLAVDGEDQFAVFASQRLSAGCRIDDGEAFMGEDGGFSLIDAAPVRAAVTDTFTPPLRAISVTFNGTAWTEPTNYTYDAATGAFATVPGQITVPAATYVQNSTTSAWTVTPGVSVLTVTGTI